MTSSEIIEQPAESVSIDEMHIAKRFLGGRALPRWKTKSEAEPDFAVLGLLGVATLSYDRISATSAMPITTTARISRNRENSSSALSEWHPTPQGANLHGPNLSCQLFVELQSIGQIASY